jgi:hypothetical protein
MTHDFTILRLRRLLNGSGHGYAGEIVTKGQSETFTVIAEGGSLVLTLKGIDTRIAVDAFVAMRCDWREIGDVVRSGLTRVLTSSRYADQRLAA